MLFRAPIVCLIASFSAASVRAASVWGFKDAQVAVSGKGAGASTVKEQLSQTSPIAQTLSLGSKDILSVELTTTLDKKALRPHQAYLMLSEPSTGLEDSFPLTVSESGIGKVNVAHKDLPAQLLASIQPLQGSILIGSFGSASALNTAVFSVQVVGEQTVEQGNVNPARYGKREEIHHIFRSDPKSPPVFITAVFAAIVFGMLPVLLGTWFTIGGNLNDLPDALAQAPLSYALFVGSIFAMEGVFFLYYINWTLFQILPVATIVGAVSFLSGTRALSDIQERRLAGKR